MNRINWIKQYQKIARENRTKKGFTKEQALKRVYEVKGKYDRTGKRIQAILHLPISLATCKVKLTEVRRKK